MQGMRERVGEGRVESRELLHGLAGPGNTRTTCLPALQANQVPDRPAVARVVLPPDMSLQDEKATTKFVESVTRESGSSSRTFKSALISCVPESTDALCDEARKVLVWEDIEEEADDLKLDDTQKRQLDENVKKAKRDVKETIWRTYKAIMLPGKDNTLKKVDLGLGISKQKVEETKAFLRELGMNDDLSSS
jgi:hypothetical protein